MWAFCCFELGTSVQLLGLNGVLQFPKAWEPASIFCAMQCIIVSLKRSFLDHVLVLICRRNSNVTEVNSNDRRCRHVILRYRTV